MINIITTKSITSIHNKLLSGILWKILSCAAFAGINIIVRYLSGASCLAIEQKLPTFVIIFFQNLIGVIFLLCIFKNQKHIQNTNILFSLIKSKYLILQIIRVIIATIGIGLWYFSLTKMPVPQVVAISFIGPILTIVGAAVLLKEKLNLKRHAAIILSMTGSFLITRPDLAFNYGLLNWVAIFPIGAALIFAMDKLITKKLFLLQECPKLTTIYLLLLITPCSLIFILLDNSWVTPVYSNFLPLIALGLLGATAHFAFNKSLENAEVTVVMPYGIFKIIFSSILSYIVFAEIPNSISIWLGIIIISLSTVLLLNNTKINRA